ncbi:hypothetical protein [Jatrophihabitans endophyticus]|uniref:hypothetical protein n=1 Tax=Jatrophihabitans endophyticus TaxID=1206085 RepID=UPI0019FAA932|nr:hypothetical protein [Jatrophihabitans endophyticus]MBE7190007.1 hypothetical protein [Jatrophihabitans endophyticus]
MTRSVPLRSAVVARVTDEACVVLGADASVTARFAPQFPTPHVERVSPGHRVALALAPDGGEVVVWRWYDAVVVGTAGTDVLLWEPAHGEVVARQRTPGPLRPGTRHYLSAGLPGAEWWAAGPAVVGPDADVELDEVDRLYAEHGLWDAALGS